MKIAFLNYYQANRGLETFVQELAQRLSKSNKVLLLNGSQKEASVRDPISLFQRFFVDKDSLNVCKWTLKNLRQIKDFKPNVIIPTNGGWQALIISVFSRFTKSKMVITGQSGPGWDDRWNLFCNPHTFVALTGRQQKWARKATPWFRHKIAMIPNGVDLEKFSPLGKKQKLKLEKPIILMVAATVPYKRVEQGIAAISRLKQGSLLLIGKGPLDKRTDSLGYKLLGKHRYLRLTVPFKQIPAYYRSADLFTLCSTSTEAFGIVYLEAHASGLACVATDDASRREIIGKAGIFVKNPDNASEYSLALKKALGKKWGNTPLSQVQKFSWDAIAQKYEKMFSCL
ncbi:glycosyltransferase family 4 protein [Patescibacteria group bacterium]|nr:glycosyltransferase family 4 protein [Patescibacteria group bacterium]MBU1256084.1 glycosyltransferase family 4 protein [Patescibacteria group bacterium]MBU1457614.1 glycosyltransferase family 4 protein [Patescibacteria group bacterium]